jgi:hypothetical protein
MRSDWYLGFVLFWLVLVVGAFAGFITVMKKRGFKFGRDVIVQCGAGHYYTTIWVPGVSLKAVRWGAIRFQRCPVGKHWASARLVNPKEVTPEISEIAAQHHDVRIP